MSKILTIVIPTYNMEKYLRKCLDSLIVTDENMLLLEVLVINDGSKDSSSMIAHEYEARFPQTFRVIDKENGNYGSCVNRGLKEATGRYVKVLDADDSFTEVFDSYVNYLKSQAVDMIITDFDIVDENGVTIMPVSYTLPKKGTFSLSLLSERESIYLWHHAITYRSDLFDKFEYKQTEGISYSDEEWVFKPMAFVENVCYFHKTLYHYLRGREGQTYDPEIIKRSRPQLDIMLNSLIVFYSQYRDKITDSGVAKFLHNRIIMILSKMYRYYILEQCSEDGYKKISDFDSQLETTCKFLYEEMGKFLFKPKLFFNYISRWRKVNYNQHDYILSSYRVVCKALDNVREIRY